MSGGEIVLMLLLLQLKLWIVESCTRREDGVTTEVMAALTSGLLTFLIVGLCTRNVLLSTAAALVDGLGMGLLRALVLRLDNRRGGDVWGYHLALFIQQFVFLGVAYAAWIVSYT